MAVILGPNPSTLAASRLVENLAQPVTDALDHIARELAHCGAPGAQTLEDGSSSSEEWTTTERAAARVEWLRGQRQQIHDDVRAVALIAYSLGDTLRHVMGTRLADTANDKPRCFGGGLEGYHLPRFEADGKTLLSEEVRGWSSPECTNLPRRGDTGICDACYMRHRRWRERRGLKPLAEEIPAA